jgi:hypothetical protein
VISQTKKPLFVKQTQEAKFHALCCGIRTRDPSNQEAVDLRLVRTATRINGYYVILVTFTMKTAKEID